MTITLATNPGNLKLTLDGQPAPLSFVGVVGMQRSLGAVSPQDLHKKTYVFNRWSDGGAQSHVIAMPAVNTTYTAFFDRQRPRGFQAVVAPPPVFASTGVAVPGDETSILQEPRSRKKK